MLKRKQLTNDGSCKVVPSVKKATGRLLVPVFTDNPTMNGRELARVAFCSDPCWGPSV